MNWRKRYLVGLWVVLGIIFGLLWNNLTIAVPVGLAVGASLDQWQQRLDAQDSDQAD